MLTRQRKNNNSNSRHRRHQSDPSIPSGILGNNATRPLGRGNGNDAAASHIMDPPPFAPFDINAQALGLGGRGNNMAVGDMNPGGQGTTAATTTGVLGRPLMMLSPVAFFYWRLYEQERTKTAALVQCLAQERAKTATLEEKTETLKEEAALLEATLKEEAAALEEDLEEDKAIIMRYLVRACQEKEDFIRNEMQRIRREERAEYRRLIATQRERWIDYTARQVLEAQQKTTNNLQETIEDLQKKVSEYANENGICQLELGHADRQLVKITKERDALRQAKECKVCFSNDIDCFLSSCGHAAMCMECAETIASSDALCPICRRRFPEYQQMFFG